MSDYDFTPKVNPMQGLSIADLVAAKTPSITTAMQGAPAILQALKQRQLQAQQQSLMQQASGGDPQTQALLQLGIVPPQFRAHPQQTPEQIEQAAAARARGTNSVPKMAITRKQDQQQFDENMWQKVGALSPTQVKSGLIHVASVNNARADRALTNLNDPNMVVQQLDAVSADVAGIMQGGVPHEAGTARQGFGNILTRWASLKSDLLSSPQAINNPATVAKLKQIVNDIKNVDNRIIKNHMDNVENTYSDLFKRNPERAKKWRDIGMESTTGFEPSDTPKSTTKIGRFDVTVH